MDKKNEKPPEVAVTTSEEGKDVFANLKQAFEEAVEHAVSNGMRKFEVREIRRSELLQVVVNEASRRLKERNRLYDDTQIANVITGRKKYHEHY
jgi:hypothetical protein